MGKEETGEGKERTEKKEWGSEQGRERREEEGEKGGDRMI